MIQVIYYCFTYVNSTGTPSRTIYIKTIFKKFIVFEQGKQGSAASVDAAKAKMKLYVNSFSWW